MLISVVGLIRSHMSGQGRKAGDICRYFNLGENKQIAPEQRQRLPERMSGREGGPSPQGTAFSVSLRGVGDAAVRVFPLRKAE